ncbi:MAG: metallophosphoesterase [Oscillospiraceae bacterium]|nr:metallophosphoesterase [Oscillospiraceae bacterium]
MALKFNSGKFTVLQVSDPQDLQFVRKTMVKMLDAAYDRVNPDLVVFTGDNILGNHLRDARFGSRKVILSPDGEYEAMKTAIHHIAEPVDRRGIPFTMIYGNHDDMNFISKEKQAEIWRGYDSFVGLDDSGDSGDVATFNLPVMSSDGKKTAFNLWFIDSARLDKAEEKCHTGVKKQAVEWYINKSNRLKEQNGGKSVPSVLFQHIPFSEMTRLNSPCKKDDYGALPLFKKGEPEKYIRLDPAVADGFLGEPIDGCEENNGEFDAIKKQGDVAAAVFGHDHRNNFIAELDGIRIFQSSAASFRCYGNRFRGVRVIEINENEPESVKTYFLTYSELCGNGPVSRLRYIWDADGEGKKKAALIAFVSAAAITSATAAAIGRKKK